MRRVALLLVLLLLLAGCAGESIGPSASRSTTKRPSTTPPAPAPPPPPPSAPDVAPWAPLPWKPIACDRSGVRSMPRNAVPEAATNGTSDAVVARFAAALGLTVAGPDALRADEAAFADAAWRLSAGRVVEHVAAETGRPSEWSYLVQDRGRAEAWLAAPQAQTEAVLDALGVQGDRLRVAASIANTTEATVTDTLPLDLGDLTLLQAIADVYGSNATAGSLQVRLFPLVGVARAGLASDRAALQAAARAFLDCWLPQRSNYRTEWTVTAQPSFPVVRGDGLRLRVPYVVRTEKDTCFVTVDVDAQTTAIWHAAPELALGDPLAC